MLVIALGLVSAIFLKGPTLDEYWTIFYTDPGAGLLKQWRWWSADTGHPVGYYALMRAYASVLPQSVETGRLVNIVPLVIFLWMTLAARGSKPVREFSQLFAIILLGGYCAIDRFAEHRAYFTGLMLLAMLVVTLHRGFASDRLSSRLALLTGLLAICLALFDYPGFAAGFALLVAAAICMAVSGRRKEAVWTAAAAVAGLAVAALSILNALGYERVEPAYRVSMGDFAGNAVVVGGSVILGNVVLAFLALRAGARFMRGHGGWQAGRDWLRSGDFTACLMLALVFALAGFTMLNAAAHVLVKRQLIGLVPLIAGLIACLAQGERPGPVARRLVLLATAASVLATLFLLHGQPNFRRFGSLLAAEQKRCPGYTIYAVSPDEIVGPATTSNRRHFNLVLAQGYRDIARKSGFRLSDPVRDRRFDAKCGGAIWMEHAWLDPVPPAASLARSMGFALDPRQGAAATMQLVGSSLLIRVPGREGR